MKSPILTALVVGAGTALLTAALCLAYGGGGLAVPGALVMLVGSAGFVGFLAGLIAAVKPKS